MLYTLTFPGHCPAKKSLYRQGRGRLYFNKDVRQKIDSLVWFAREQWGDRPPLNVCENIVAHFFVLHYNADMDGKWATILDVLEKARVIRNDNMSVLAKASQDCRKEGAEKTVVEIWSPEHPLFETGEGEPF